MRLVTVATSSQGYFPVLKQSCQRFGIDLDILGWGSKWEGFAMKFKLMRDYLDGLADPYELVCFIDAFDIIILNPLSQLESQYEKLCPQRDKILVAAEYPKPIVRWAATLYFGGNGKYIINSGSYVAPVWLLRQFFAEVCGPECDSRMDDQFLLIKFQKKHEDKVYVDIHQEVFYPEQYPIRLRIENEKVVICDKKDPFLIHGIVNNDMHEISKALGYDLSDVKRRASIEYASKNSFLQLSVSIALLVLCFLAFLFNYLKG